MPEARPRRPKRKHKYPLFGGAPMYVTGYDGTGVYGMVPMHRRRDRSPKRRSHSPHKKRDKSPQRNKPRRHHKHRHHEKQVYANFPAPVIVAPQPMMGRQPVMPRPVMQPPVVQSPVMQAPVVQSPMMQAQPMVQPPVIQARPVVQAPVIQARPVVQAPVIQAQPVVQAPVVRRPAPAVQVPVAMSEPGYYQKAAPTAQINKPYLQYLKPVNYDVNSPMFQKKPEVASLKNGQSKDDTYELGPLFARSATLRDTQSEVYGWEVSKRQPTRLVSPGGETNNHTVYRVLHKTIELNDEIE